MLRNTFNSLSPGDAYKRPHIFLSLGLEMVCHFSSVKPLPKPIHCQLDHRGSISSEVWIEIRKVSGADPGFEVRGGAKVAQMNGLKNLKRRGGCKNIFQIRVFQIWYILNTVMMCHYNIVYLLSPLIQYCNTKSHLKNFSGGARPVRPPLNPPLGFLSEITLEMKMMTVKTLHICKEPNNTRTAVWR